MIVISNIEKFKELKESFNFVGCDLIPVAIKSNLFILGEEVLSDQNFTDFFKEFTDYEIREINNNEFIEVKR